MALDGSMALRPRVLSRDALKTFSLVRFICRGLGGIYAHKFSVDGPLAGGLRALLDKTASMGTSFFAIILVSPVFTIPGAMFTVLGGWCGQMYMRAQLPVKREQSVARAPILGHLAATVSGIGG